jgi:hypothetical protein
MFLSIVGFAKLELVKVCDRNDKSSEDDTVLESIVTVFNSAHATVSMKLVKRKVDFPKMATAEDKTFYFASHLGCTSMVKYTGILNPTHGFVSIRSASKIENWIKCYAAFRYCDHVYITQQGMQYFNDNGITVHLVIYFNLYL